MDDYISREAAIALTDQHCFETSYDAVWMEEELRKLPAADVVEVVRCKDCKHLKDNNCGYCDVWEQYISNPDYFCGSGERGADNGN